MKIGVLSDTHLVGVTGDFERILREYLSDCEAIIHVGDFTDIKVYEYLKEFVKGKIFAVCGNMDGGAIRQVLPERMVIEVEGVKLGLMHGWGPPQGIEERIRTAFEGEGVRAIVYGHTHSPANHWSSGILFFNPGSPTDRIYAKRNTLGILEIERGQIEGRIVDLRTP